MIAQKCTALTGSRRLAICAAGFAMMLPTQAAIDIQFDYTYDTGNFFALTERRNVLEAAALTFEARITDNLTAITPSGSNTWTAIFDHPSTGVEVEVINPTIAAGVIRVYVGAQDLAGSTLGFGGPGGFSASGNSAFLNNVELRGQVSGTTDFGPWGGAISFDNATQWYFDQDITTKEPFGVMNDFYSVSIHELAHLLGFGTSDSWDNLISAGTFTGTASMAENGGVAVPLAGTGHWANGTQSEVLSPSPINPQEAAMDPSITVGTRKYFKELDFAGLDDIGWQVIPEPGSTLLIASGIVFVAGMRRRREEA